MNTDTVNTQAIERGKLVQHGIYDIYRFRQNTYARTWGLSSSSILRDKPNPGGAFRFTSIEEERPNLKPFVGEESRRRGE